MPSSQKVTFSLTNRTILRIILWVIGAILVWKFVGTVSNALYIIFASFFLALALNPAVSGIKRRLHLKGRIRATAAAYVVVIAVIGLFCFLVFPPLVSQTRSFISDVPHIIQNFQTQDSALAKTARRYNVDQRINQAASNFASHYSDYGGTILDTGKRIITVVASIFAVLVMTFMMLVEGPTWLELLWGIMPANRREHHKRIAHRMYRGVSGFVNGQIILAIVAGIFAFIAMEIASRIISVNGQINALALAGIVSVFGLIPLFGNPAAAIIVILVSAINSLALGIVMLIYFIVYFFIENHTFQPYIQSRLNELTPLTVFVAAILGIGLGGLLGAIIAIPVASAVKILIEDYFETRRHRRAPTENLPAASS